MHIIARCPPSIEIWEHFKHIYKSFVPDRIINPANSIFLLDKAHFSERHPVARLLLTITQIIMGELWSSRCHLMFRNKKLIPQTIIKIIIRKLTQIIEIKYHYHAERDILNIFSECFCFKNIMCHLESGKLKITI